MFDKITVVKVGHILSMMDLICMYLSLNIVTLKNSDLDL